MAEAVDILSTASDQYVTRLAARLKSSIKCYRGTLVATSHLSASATRMVEVVIRRGVNVYVQDLFFGVVHLQVLHVCAQLPQGSFSYAHAHSSYASGLWFFLLCLHVHSYAAPFRWARHFFLLSV